MSQHIPEGATGALSVLASGSPPLTYQWRLNGTNIPSNFISTVAGNGSPTVSGDGGVATEAGLRPIGVAVDSLGNLFISETANHRIRKVDINRVISTVAGNGVAGYSGDGGPATNASLNEPFGIRVDLAGNLYFADSLNNRVRKVDTNGIITTVAGTGVASRGGDGGAATNAGLNYPLDVAVSDDGSLVIADTGNSSVRKVDSRGVITLVAGTDGAGTGLELIYVSSVAVDAQGNVLIADEVEDLITEGPTARVYKLDPNGVVTTPVPPRFQVTGENGVTRTEFQIAPSGLALSSQGDLFVVDREYGLVRKLEPNGTISTVAGDVSNSWGFSGDGGPARDARFNRPFMAAVDASGQLYVTDSSNYRVRKVALLGSPALPIAGVSSAVGDYQVIISNTSGSVTSAVATVTVAGPLLSASLLQGRFQINFTGAPGRTYVLESSPALNAPIAWQPIYTNTVEASGAWHYTQSDEPITHSRYFRLSSR